MVAFMLSLLLELNQEKNTVKKKMFCQELHLYRYSDQIYCKIKHHCLSVNIGLKCRLKLK